MIKKQTERHAPHRKLGHENKSWSLDGKTGGAAMTIILDIQSLTTYLYSPGQQLCWPAKAAGAWKDDYVSTIIGPALNHCQ